MALSTSASRPSGKALTGDVPLLETRNRGLLLLSVVMISLCQAFDATIANVSLPYMKTALGASDETISWVLTSFITSTAIGIPVAGWLSDYLGSRNLFMLATAVFLVSSAACGAAPSLSFMIAFRIVQGLSAAFIGPLTMTILFDISPPSKQAMAVSLYGMILMVAPITGPFIGAYLTEYLNWRWVFYVNLPIGIPALALIWWLLPSRAINRRKLDAFGFATIAIGLGALQLMLDRGQGRDWFSSKEIVLYMILTVSAFWIFFLHNRGNPNPLFQPSLFTDRNFVAGLVFMVVLGGLTMGLAAILPTMFQTIYGYPVVEAGFLMAPRGLGVVCTSLTAGYIARKFDARGVIMFGYLIVAAATWAMTRWTLEMGSWQIALPAFVQGMGFGIIMTPVQLMAFATIDPRLRPDASSLSGLSRSLGSSIGISVLVTLLTRNQQVSYADLAGKVTANSFPVIDLPSLVASLGGMGDGIMAMIDAEVRRQAAMIAYLDNFYLLFWLTIIFAPLPLFLKKPKMQR